jgi:hypothetical protein
VPLNRLAGFDEARVWLAVHAVISFGGPLLVSRNQYSMHASLKAVVYWRVGSALIQSIEIRHCILRARSPSIAAGSVLLNTPTPVPCRLSIHSQVSEYIGSDCSDPPRSNPDLVQSATLFYSSRQPHHIFGRQAMSHCIFEFRQRKCLSPIPHDVQDLEDIKIEDIKMHFFGCLRVNERLEFLSDDANHVLWQTLADAQARRQTTGRSKDQSRLHRTNSDEQRRMRWQIAESLQDEFKKTDIVREAIANDLMLSHLVTNIVASGNKWKKGHKVCCKARDGTSGSSMEKETTDGHSKVREELKKIVSDYVKMSIELRARPLVEMPLPFDRKRSSLNSQSGEASGGSSSTSHLHLLNPNKSGDTQDATHVKNLSEGVSIPKYEIDQAVRARVMRFERSERDEWPCPFVGKSIEGDQYSGIFPEQDVAIGDLFSRWVGGRFCRMANTGTKGHAEVIRYVHIPCNNMKVCRPQAQCYHNYDF